MHKFVIYRDYYMAIFISCPIPISAQGPEADMGRG